jgi:hypothetical protein
MHLEGPGLTVHPVVADLLETVQCVLTGLLAGVAGAS